MDQRTLISRLLSPAGFGLVLLLFLTPFLTVSCSVPADVAADAGAPSSYTLRFSGTDLLAGGAPTLSTSQPLSADAQAEFAATIKELLDIEPLAVLAAVIVFIGMVVGMVRSGRLRFAASAILALVTLGLLIGAYFRAVRTIDAGMATASAELETTLTHSTAPAVGFWLMLSVLVLLLAGNAVALARARPDPAPPPAPPPPPEVFPFEADE